MGVPWAPKTEHVTAYASQQFSEFIGSSSGFKEVLLPMNFLIFDDREFSPTYKHCGSLPKNISLTLVRWRDPISLP